MDSSCPHCHKSLSGRWLRSHISSKATFACTACGAGIEFNVNPNEGRISSLAMVPVSMVIIAHLFGVQIPIILVFAAAASLVAGVFYEFYFYLVSHATWPRYRLVHAPNPSFKRDA